MGPRRRPLVESEGQLDMPTVVLAALICKSDKDELQVSAADIDRIYELFPHGWGVVVAGDGSGAIRVSLVGETAQEGLEALLEGLRSGGRAAVPKEYLPRHDGQGGV